MLFFFLFLFFFCYCTVVLSVDWVRVCVLDEECCQEKIRKIYTCIQVHVYSSDSDLREGIISLYKCDVLDANIITFRRVC